MTASASRPSPRPREPRTRTWVTFGLIAANVIMFVVELAAGADFFEPTGASVLGLGANFAPLTLDGEPWRLASSLFVHFGILHLAMNMLCLYQVRVVELLFGRAAFAVLYVAAGLAGSVATLMRSEPAISAGASGAVFGVFGALAVFVFLERERLGRDVATRQLGSIASFLVLNFVIGLSVPGIDLQAHVGGLLMGAVAGFALAFRQPRGIGRGRIALVAVLSLGATTAATFALDTGPSYADLRTHADGVEHACLDRLNALATQSTNGQLGDRAFADAIEREIIPPWRAERLALEQSLADLPSSRVEVFTLVAEYFKAREDHFVALVAALREGFTPDAPSTKRVQATAAVVEQLMRTLKARFTAKPDATP